MSNVLLGNWIPKEVLSTMFNLAREIVIHGDKERGGYNYLLGKLAEEIGEFVEALEYDDTELGEELIDVVMLLVQISVLGENDPEKLFTFTEEEIGTLERTHIVGMGDFAIAIGAFMEVHMKTTFPARKTMEEKYGKSPSERLFEVSRRIIYLMDRELEREEPEFKIAVVKGAEYKLSRLAKVHNIKQ